MPIIHKNSSITMGSIIYFLSCIIQEHMLKERKVSWRYNKIHKSIYIKLKRALAQLITNTTTYYYYIYTNYIELNFLKNILLLICFKTHTTTIFWKKVYLYGTFFTTYNLMRQETRYETIHLLTYFFLGWVQVFWMKRIKPLNEIFRPQLASDLILQ